MTAHLIHTWAIVQQGGLKIFRVIPVVEHRFLKYESLYFLERDPQGPEHPKIMINSIEQIKELCFITKPFESFFLPKCVQGLPEATDAILRGHQSPIFNHPCSQLSKIVTNIGLRSVEIRELKFCYFTKQTQKK